MGDEELGIFFYSFANGCLGCVDGESYGGYWIICAPYHPSTGVPGFGEGRREDGMECGNDVVYCGLFFVGHGSILAEAKWGCWECLAGYGG